MKKIAIIFVSLLLCVCFSVGVCADFVTTSPKETTAATSAIVSDGLVYENDITMPITFCIIAACAICVFGIIKLKKVQKEEAEDTEKK